MKMEEGLTWEDSFQSLIFSKGEDSSALQKCWLSLSTSAPHPTERKLQAKKPNSRQGVRPRQSQSDMPAIVHPAKRSGWTDFPMFHPFKLHRICNLQ